MIDLRFRKPGEIIYLETPRAYWELELLDDKGIVRVDTTDPKLNTPKRAQFSGSISSKYEERPHQIVKNWATILNFKDCAYLIGPVQSAAVKGKGWEYEVF